MIPSCIRRFTSTAACILALVTTAPRSQAVPVDVSGADYSSVPLLRGKQNQLLLRQMIGGHPAYITLDTGSPVTCVDESKSKLFSLVPTSTDGTPPMSVTVNGERHRIAVIPSLEFDALSVQDIPVVLIDLTDLNRVLRARRDHPNDAIMGLDTLHALHAVIDCGSNRLLLRNSPNTPSQLGTVLKRAGWKEISMHVSEGHCVVGGFVNQIPMDFIVDTGSPVSVLDATFCKAHHVTLTDQTFAMKAIHFETNGAKVGRVNDLIIGKHQNLGQSLVAVFDVTSLLKSNVDAPSSVPGGLLGSRTLSRTSAFIDCENMKLYVKVTQATGNWGF
jgi:predicted aspartyl protease